MKKFMKTCAIIALVMIVAGIALGIVASTRAGRSTISQVVEAATGGRVRLEFDEGWGFFGRLELGDMEVGIPGLGVDYMESYDIGDASMFSKNHEILSGDVDMYSLGSEIRNMEVQVGGCHFETKFSKDDAIYVETKNVRKFQGYVEGDTLYVLATTVAGVSWSNKKSTVILYLPQDYEFDQVEIDMGAGELEFDRLNAKEASLEVGAGRILLGSAKAQELKAEVGAGQIEFKDMAVGKLDVEVGMGEFLAQGAVSGDVEVDCSMGNVEIELEGRKEDFNYQLEGAMGSIQLDGDNMGGFAQEKSISNGADKSMRIECAMGNITLKFRK